MTDARSLSDVAVRAPRSATRARWTHIPTLGWTTFILLALYAVIIGGSWVGIYWTTLRVASLALTTAGLLAWLLVAWRYPRWRPSTAIWPAIVLPPLALGLSALASPFPRLGIEYVAWATLLAALYLLLVRFLAWPFARARVGAMAAILGLTLAAIYIGWVVLLWIEWWTLVGALTAPPMRPLFVGLTWGNPNALLTVQVLLLLIAAAGLGTSTRRSRVTLTVLALMTLFVIVVSGSRAGWLALAGAVVLVGGTWVARMAWRRAVTPRAALMRGLRDRRLYLALALLAVFTVLFLPGILARFETGGDGGRPVYFAIALRMFADAPLLGLGPGSWAARRAAYTESSELDFVTPHAHDIYLQTAAELGIVGITVGIIAFACVAWLFIAAIRGDRAARRRWAWAGGFALVYLGIHNSLDSDANMPAVLLLAAVPVAMLDATADRRLGIPLSLERVAGPLRSVALGSLIVVSAIAIVVLARGESTALTHQRAVYAANDADWREAYTPAARAVRDDPGIAPYQQTLGLAAAGVGAWHTAAGAFVAAAAIDDLPASWLGLAVAQLHVGEPAPVVAESLARALRLGTQQPAVTFAAAQVYDRIGMPASADDAFVDAMIRLPQLAAASSWDRVGVGSARFERLLTKAIDRSPASAWQLALISGDPDRARSLVPESEGRPSVYPTLIIEAWTGDKAALARVRAIANERVFDPWALSWAALVSSHVGDHEAAQRYRRILYLAFQDARSTSHVEIGPRRPSRDAEIGTNSINYGNYMHRRTSPQDLIVPGLPGVTLLEPHSIGSWIEHAVPWGVLAAAR